jgi:hypothetical protein
MFNRTVQRRNIRRHAARRNALGGGGYTFGAPLLPIPSNDWEFSVKEPVVSQTSDCYSQPIHNTNPALAQATWPLTGGGCGCAGSKLFGGSRGYDVDVSTSVGGNGPVAAPEFRPIPCAVGGGLPVYNATSAGFTFEPSTITGGTLPDGTTAYNNVVRYDARGGKKKTKTKKVKNTKKAKKTKKVKKTKKAKKTKTLKTKAKIQIRKHNRIRRTQKKKEL